MTIAPGKLIPPASYSFVNVDVQKDSNGNITSINTAPNPQWYEFIRNFVENSVTGTAGGDLGSTYPNPSVIKIQGVSISVLNATALSHLVGINTGDQTITLAGDVKGSGTGTFNTTASKINGVAFSSLTTGILKNTTTTGIPSIAVAADFPTLNQNTSGSSASCTGNAATSTTASEVTNGGALNTPGSGTLTNCTGYTDANLAISDITTNNVSTSKHGFAPKSPNDATKYLDGTGAYSIPAGSGGSGTVTSIIGGSGLSGGTITTSGTLAVINSPAWRTGIAAVPSCSAVGASNTTLATSALTKINMLGSPLWDIGSYMDHTTNSRYVPLVAGIYHVSGNIYITNPSVNVFYRVEVWKNGSTYKAGLSDQCPTSGDFMVPVSCLVNMNGSTDYLELYGYNSSGAVTATVSNGANYTYFDIHYIGPLS